MALLGLAGIGLAAARSDSSPQLLRAPLTVGLAQLVGGGADAPVDTAPYARVAGALEAGREPSTLPPATIPPPPPAPAPAAAPASARSSEPAARSPGPLPCAPVRPAAAGKGEARLAAPTAERPATAAGEPSSGGRVILNRADLAELQRLPGIGAKRAAAILELRQRLGRFRRLSDLLRIKGIGPRLLERISPQLALDE